MSDSKPRDGETETAPPTGEEESLSSQRMPAKNLPEELLQRRLGRLDTRRTLAELCKNVPGLDEILLPRGIQADALTRKSGGSSQMLRGLSRRIKQDTAAWGAFRSAVQEQIPPETSEALEDLSRENLGELSETHSTEGLLMAALTGEGEPVPETVEILLEKWREENTKAEKQASKDAKTQELREELDNLKQENEQLSFSSRIASERAFALAEEVQVLTDQRKEDSSRIKEAERQSNSVAEVREQLEGRIAELERRGAHLERSLDGERKAYSVAAERVENLHEELGQVSAERDRIRDALESARFTDKGFGDLLVRAVKNEVTALPDTLDSAARTAKLLEFMSRVLSAHAELREPRSSGARNRSPRDSKEEPEDPDPALAVLNRDSNGTAPAYAPSDTPNREPPETSGSTLSNRVESKPRPTLTFRALGGAGEVGGSSHLLDFGDTRVLVDAGIKPDGRGPVAPDFKAVEKLDAAVVTHAHLDHCGALPLLIRDRPDLPIYCTPPSARLIISALNDHAAMGGGVSGGAPIHEVGKRLVPVPFGRPIEVGGTRVTLTESGHILGAASVLMESRSAKVFHTGDICMEDHFSIPSAQLPDVSDIDLLIMEATLANQRFDPFSVSVKKMVETINDTILRQEGTVLIPTYALGQAQEIILGLKHYSREYGLDKDVFIYVDGSVVTTSERLYAEQIGYMKPYLQQSNPREVFFSENIRAVSNDDKARERILTNPCAIIASPVTMQGGASAFYRRRLENSGRNAVILPSNAGASYGAGHRAEGEEEEWRVERVSFAAHCTQDELIGITEKLTPRQIILIHGAKRRISDLAYRLAPSHKIHTPAVGETVRTIL